MADIIIFPRHTRVTCRGYEDGCNGCNLCDGGLFLCSRCLCGEGSLPTDCPGESVPFAAQMEIVEGKLDFTRKRGWYKPIVCWPIEEA